MPMYLPLYISFLATQRRSNGIFHYIKSIKFENSRCGNGTAISSLKFCSHTYFQYISKLYFITLFMLKWWMVAFGIYMHLTIGQLQRGDHDKNRATPKFTTHDSAKFDGIFACFFQLIP